MKPPVCQRCSSYMTQNLEAPEYLKCPTCAWGILKVKLGKSCGNCECTKGSPCSKLKAYNETVHN